jgi:hypothetical protein
MLGADDRFFLDLYTASDVIVKYILNLPFGALCTNVTACSRRLRFYLFIILCMLATTKFEFQSKCNRK